jgi:hypothetical protein
MCDIVAICVGHERSARRVLEVQNNAPTINRLPPQTNAKSYLEQSRIISFLHERPVENTGRPCDFRKTNRHMEK